MKKYAVDSEAMTSVGYDSKTQVLEIQFKAGGAIRQFYNVPERVFDDLMAAESHGDFFNSEINGKYSEKRVDGLVL